MNTKQVFFRGVRSRTIFLAETTEYKKVAELGSGTELIPG